MHCAETGISGQFEGVYCINLLSASKPKSSSCTLVKQQGAENGEGLGAEELGGGLFSTHVYIYHGLPLCWSLLLCKVA